MCQGNPQMMMQLVQSDPRFMDVFKELTGIDLMDMQEQKMKSDANEQETRKKAREQEEVKKAELDK